MTDTTEWTTAIAEVQDGDVVIRGHRLTDLIGSVGFVEVVFLIFRGNFPSDGERRMLDALFVSLAEHGISPSSVIARTLASCGTPVQASIAGAVVSIADWHGGSGEQLASILLELDGRSDDADDADAVSTTVQALVARRAQVPGFGHPQHPEGDPRALRLLALSDELGVSRAHVARLRQIGLALAAATGRASLSSPNVTGVVAAVTLDLGFPVEAVRGFVVAPRVVGWTAHIAEEIAQGNRWRHAAATQVNYTGPSPSDMRGAS